MHASTTPATYSPPQPRWLRRLPDLPTHANKETRCCARLPAVRGVADELLQSSRGAPSPPLYPCTRRTSSFSSAAAGAPCTRQTRSSSGNDALGREGRPSSSSGSVCARPRVPPRVARCRSAAPRRRLSRRRLRRPPRRVGHVRQPPR